MARWLALILGYLVERVGERVMQWTLREVIDYFRDNPAEGKACSEVCVRKWAAPYDSEISKCSVDDDLYFWEK